MVEAADRERDQVVCGWGEDTAIVDQLDDYGPDCERASVVETLPPDDGEPPSPLAPGVRRVAARFGVAYLRFDGAAACAAMTAEGRKAAVSFVQDALGQLEPGGGNRAQRRRHERIHRLRSGHGVFGISAAADGLSATVEEVVGVGSLIAVPAGDRWLISSWSP